MLGSRVSSTASTMRFSPAVKQSITKLLDIKSMKHMDNLSAYNPSPLTIKQFIEFGRTATEADSFHFLKREVPIRLANIMKEINLLPSSLLTMPSVIGLQQWYAASFMDLCAFEGRQGDRQDLKDFVDLLAVIAKRHTNAVQTMAQGVMELKESHDVDAQTEASIQYFLDRFYMSRMSTRMLTNQHFVLFGPSRGDETRPNWIGVLDTNCRVKNIVDAAYTNASFLCEEYYNMAPDIDITLRNEGAEKNEPIEVCYPPQHLYHILFELFKNSMRAVVEHKKRGFDLPDLAVLIAKGKSDVTIKISDQGGGIPRHIQEHLFHYLYSTAPRPSMQPTKAPLAGYGYGLPLSRLYARYLHGDLILNSYEGFGTDAVVYLKADDVESVELLPVFNMTSSKQYKSAVTAADWTDPNSNMNRFYHPRQSPRSKAARST
jgi:pyruvate dehydrogenase kinase 2/3/4